MQVTVPASGYTHCVTDHAFDVSKSMAEAIDAAWLRHVLALEDAATKALQEAQSARRDYDAFHKNRVSG